MSIEEGMPRVVGGECDNVWSTCNWVTLSIDLYWEGSPPTEIADLIHASTTSQFKRLMLRRTTKEIADADRYSYLSNSQFEILT